MIWDNLETMLPHGSLRARFARGAFWSITGTLISQGLAFVGWIVAGRVLGSTGFGELAVIQTTVGMFGVFAGLGLGLTATKHVAEFRDNEPDKAGQILGLSVVVALISGGVTALILFSGSHLIAAKALSAPHLTVVLRISCGLLFFNTLCGVGTGALVGFEAFRAIARVHLLTGLVNVTFLTLGVYYWQLSGAVGGMVAASAVGMGFHYVVLLMEARKYGVRISCHDMRSELPVLWTFAIPGCLSSMITLPTTWIASAMLVRQADGFTEMGVFHAATRFQAPLRLLGSTIGVSLLPILISAKNRLNNSRFERANILLSWFLGAIPAVLFLSFPEVLPILFGPKYSGLHATRILNLVMLYTVIILYKQGLARVLVARSLMWWGVLSNMTWAALLVSTFYWLRHWGAFGLAGSFLISYAVNTLIFIPLYIRRKLAPRGTLISHEAGIVWGTVALLAVLSFFDAPLVLRTLALLVALTVLLSAFWHLLKRENRMTLLPESQPVT